MLKMARKHPELANRVKENIAKWHGYFSFNNKQFHEEMAFVMGGQWEKEELTALRDNKKIPLIVNKLGVLANHLLGEQRQNTPNLQAVPDETVDEQTAEVRDALIKEITFDSKASVVYQTAFQCAVIGGFGAYRINHDYVDERSFEQHINILPINDPTKAFWDVGATTPSKTDGMFAGVKTYMSRKKFREVYGKRIESKIKNYTLNDDTVMANDESILVIDYYEREYKTIRIRKLSNGRTIEPDEYRRMREYQEELQLIGIQPADDLAVTEQAPQPGIESPDDLQSEIEITDEMPLIDLQTGEQVTIIDERDAPRFTIKYYKVAGEYELESSEFPAELLPVIFVDQNSYYDKNGKQFCRPFFKDANDSQKYINYIRTHSAYLLKVSRNDQFLVSKENVRGKDTQAIWKNPGNYQGGLFFDKDSDGFVPQQLRPPELSQSLVQQYQLALSDIQSSTGMYDTQMGQQGNEISGAAIDARTERGSFNTFVAFDSLNRAIAVGGEIINQMIPVIYDTERTVMLTMPEVGSPVPVDINKVEDEYGLQVKNDMTKGHYKIKLLPGPNSAGQRQQALESLQMVLQANPQLFNMIADLYAENLPLKNNINLRNRLRTLVPPEILEAGKTGQAPPPQQQGPSPEEQAMQMQQQQMQAQLQIKQQELQLKVQELALKQQKLAMDAEKDQADIEQKWQALENERLMAAADLEETQLRYQAEMHRTNMDGNIEHARNITNILTHLK
jgi:hypothetical protein